MKILVDYDQTTGAVTLPDGYITYGVAGAQFNEHKDESSILDLVKQGLTADDLINLKKQDLI